MMVPTSFELGSFISFIISFITNDIRKFYLASTWENCTRRRLYVKVSLKNLLLGKNLLPIYTTEAKSFLKNQTVFSVLFFGSQRRTTTTTEIFQSTFLIAITMAVNFFWLKSSFLNSPKFFFFFFFFFFQKKVFWVTRDVYSALVSSEFWFFLQKSPFGQKRISLGYIYVIESRHWNTI